MSSNNRASTKKKMLGYQVVTRYLTRGGNPHSLPGLPKNAESKTRKFDQNLGTWKTKNPTEKKKSQFSQTEFENIPGSN